MNSQQEDKMTIETRVTTNLPMTNVNKGERT